VSSQAIPARRAPARGSLIYDPKVRGIVFQLVLVAIVGFLIYEAAVNAIDNLQRAKIASGFGFLNNTSGFDVNQTLVPYNAQSTYGQAFIVGLLNTLLVAAVGIVLATILGFLVGVARLSTNWIVAQVAMVYVELVRNLPLLLQLLFWYNAVLAPLPAPRESIAVNGLQWGAPNILDILLLIVAGVASFVLARAANRLGRTDMEKLMGRIVAGLLALIALVFLLPRIGLIRATETGIAFLNNRGLILPKPVPDDRAWMVPAALALGLVATVLFRIWAKRQQAATGRQYPVGLFALAALLGLPALVWVLLALTGGNPIGFDVPQKGRFNLTGGLQVYPEFVALLLGLVTYTAGFIAEVVRAGILAVSKGQTEAANALGLRPGPTLRLVVVPQAMRVIVPPLTSQYLNLTKNSSLAVAIGYPDLVQVFAGTVLNQTGQALEVIAITMAVYLTISLVTSFFMNIYNRRVAIVER
jgi:general L-amino acid transport system permease protein